MIPAAVMYPGEQNIFKSENMLWWPILYLPFWSFKKSTLSRDGTTEVVGAAAREFQMQIYSEIKINLGKKYDIQKIGIICKQGQFNGKNT